MLNDCTVPDDTVPTNFYTSNSTVRWSVGSVLSSRAVWSAMVFQIMGNKEILDTSQDEVIL